MSSLPPFHTSSGAHQSLSSQDTPDTVGQNPSRLPVVNFGPNHDAQMASLSTKLSSRSDNLAALKNFLVAQTQGQKLNLPCQTKAGQFNSPGQFLIKQTMQAASNGTAGNVSGRISSCLNMLTQLAQMNQLAGATQNVPDTTSAFSTTNDAAKFAKSNPDAETSMQTAAKFHNLPVFSECTSNQTPIDGLREALKTIESDLLQINETMTSGSTINQTPAQIIRGTQATTPPILHPLLQNTAQQPARFLTTQNQNATLVPNNKATKHPVSSIPDKKFFQDVTQKSSCDALNGYADLTKQLATALTANTVASNSTMKVMSEETPGAIVRRSMGVLVTLNSKKFKPFDDASSVPPSKDSLHDLNAGESSSSSLGDEIQELDPESEDSSVIVPKMLSKTHKSPTKASKATGPASKNRGDGSVVAPSSAMSLQSGGRRARRRIQPEQSEVLEEAFKKSAMWSTSQIKGLAKRLGLTRVKVYKWNWDRRNRDTRIDLQKDTQATQVHGATSIEKTLLDTPNKEGEKMCVTN